VVWAGAGRKDAMNPDLQKQLAEMLAKLTDATQNAAIWVGGQVPPLIHEKIVLGRAEMTGFIILALVCALIASMLFVSSFRHGWFTTDNGFARFMGGCALTVFTLGLFGSNIHEFLMVWFAPRLYIVEWLKSMVTK